MTYLFLFFEALRSLYYTLFPPPLFCKIFPSTS